MENFKQDLDIPNSESNTETEFSRQVEECQSNLYRIEQLFFNLQKDSQRQLERSQDSLAKLLNSNKKKLNGTGVVEQTPLQEVYVKDHFPLSNNVTLKRDNSATSEKSVINNNNSAPLTFVVQVPNSIIDEFKKNFAHSDILNYLSRCSSKQSMKGTKKKGISSLFHNLFKRKKNNVPNLNALLLKHIKFVKFVTEPNHIVTQVDQISNQSNIDHTLVSENNFSIKNATDVGLSNASENSQDGHTLVFPTTFNSNTNIHDSAKSNLIIQHEITPKQNSSLYTHTIKITNEPLSNCQNESSPKFIAEKVDSERKELEKSSLDKLKSENNLMKSFIENLLKSTKNLNDLEILKIFVEILHEEKLKKKTPCCIHCSNTKVDHNRESNFLHNFLQQLMVELQNKIKPSEKKNIQQAPKRQSSKISICSSTAGISSEDEYFDHNLVVSKSKRMHKTSRRCQSPSLLKYRFCQSEKDIDKTENIKNK